MGLPASAGRGTARVDRIGQVIALYIFGCAIVSIAAMAALPSSRDRDFARDHI
jgi:hypothetical protein